MPLGKLSKATITRGYQALKDLSALFSDPSLAQSKHETHYNAAVENLSNRYCGKCSAMCIWSAN